MALELVGTLEVKLPVQSGTSARGPWKKQDFIISTQETYPRKVCINVWGEDKVTELDAIHEGTLLKISVNIESREFNGRWYTDVRAWKIENFQQMPAQQPAADYGDTLPEYEASEADDLPF